MKDYFDLVSIMMFSLGIIGFLTIVIGGIRTVDLNVPYRKTLFKFDIIALSICFVLTIVMILLICKKLKGV